MAPLWLFSRAAFTRAIIDRLNLELQPWENCCCPRGTKRDVGDAPHQDGENVMTDVVGRVVVLEKASESFIVHTKNT